jgi:hypothetical protein
MQRSYLALWHVTQHERFPTKSPTWRGFQWNPLPYCPSVQTVVLLLYVNSIIRTSVRTVLPWRLDGCNSSPRLALSRIASRRCRPDVWMYATVFPGNSILCRTLMSARTCCWDVRTDATFNSSKLLDTDGHPNGIAMSSGWMLMTDKSLDGCLGFNFFDLESTQNLLWTSWSTFLKWRLWNKLHPWLCSNII